MRDVPRSKGCATNNSEFNSACESMFVTLIKLILVTFEDTRLLQTPDRDNHAKAPTTRNHGVPRRQNNTSLYKDKRVYYPRESHDCFPTLATYIDPILIHARVHFGIPLQISGNSCACLSCTFCLPRRQGKRLIWALWDFLASAHALRFMMSNSCTHTLYAHHQTL